MAVNSITDYYSDYDVSNEHINITHNILYLDKNGIQSSSFGDSKSETIIIPDYIATPIIYIDPNILNCNILYTDTDITVTNIYINSSSTHQKTHFKTPPAVINDNNAATKRYVDNVYRICNDRFNNAKKYIGIVADDFSDVSNNITPNNICLVRVTSTSNSLNATDTLTTTILGKPSIRSTTETTIECKGSASLFGDENTSYDIATPVIQNTITHMHKNIPVDTLSTNNYDKILIIRSDIIYVKEVTDNDTK